MKQEAAVKRVQELLDNSRVGILSTAQDNVPNARYMIFYNDGLTLYTKTSDKTEKYGEVGANPLAHILLGYTENSHNAYVEVFGDVERVDDQQTVDWLWSQQDKTYFDSKEDSDLKVLKITPTDIKIMNDDKFENVELEF
jgi:general stress protein 26